MNKVKIGIIGYGGMGATHGKSILKGEIPNAELKAVTSIFDSSIATIKKDLPDSVTFYKSAEELISSSAVDAVIIATPHYSHPKYSIMALENNLHVLTEKPAGVHTKAVNEMNAVAEKSDKVFAIMFNQRTRAIHRKLKDLIASGELGSIKRTNWIITTWYRAQSYFDAGGWRATWEGEGGGVLLNQSPHQLDLWQWICGMPKRVRAFCAFGKYHDIEVEDDVTAYVEYENGATGVFITSTGEAPGSDRFEIVGDNGKIIMEDGKIIFWRNRVSERDFNRDFKDGFGSPEVWKCEIPFDGKDEEHKAIIKNFIDAILNNAKLIAPAEEGINSLQLSNAMLLSSWQDDWVELPLNDDIFYEKLQDKIKNSNTKKDSTKSKIMDVKGTH